ncbi:hypothetical protein F5Y18DRAFT_392737 [Xylariaceae sp. FL1019]|nr:hypothetical protein F5Y18DRAFT_392737 [Xylariaceae sp. FL1019]
MQRRALTRRLSLLPAVKPRSPTTPRLTIARAQLASQARPQLPFLSTPLAGQGQFRYLTTERKRWIVFEVYRGFKFTLYFWAMAGCSLVAFWCVQQEWFERQWPSPHEWSFISRVRFRFCNHKANEKGLIKIEWPVISQSITNLIERLEDRNLDGEGLQDLIEGGIWIDGIGNSGLDIQTKSENWRRGYYEALMLAAKCAEHLDDHVLDTTRRIVFPAEHMIGPSNPHPKPIPFGSASAPHEENCIRAFVEPETFYMRILTTRGFSTKQKMDAALGYASWLDYKNIPDAATRMYEWALSIASENTSQMDLPYDTQSYVIKEGTRHPASNILASLTAIGAHKARNDDIATALPILLSVLRARRSLPQPSSNIPTTTSNQHTLIDSAWAPQNILNTITHLVSPPAYPPPPPSGEEPPVRDAKELCEEAGLNLYIGEIIYASGSSHEDGIAWTREAVDLAEQQLHTLKSEKDVDDEAKRTCRECLSSGLGNWGMMVERLIREEHARKEKVESEGAGKGWLGLWGKSNGDGAVKDESSVGRWEAEGSVVKERVRRAQDVLEEVERPSSLLGAALNVFKA